MEDKNTVQGKYILVNSDFFEHLLNCLDNQKAIDNGYHPRNAQNENQIAIDKANREAREIWHGKSQTLEEIYNDILRKRIKPEIPVCENSKKLLEL